MFSMVTLLLILILATLWWRWRTKKLSYWQNLGIPGPKPSFWFGNLWEMQSMTPLKAHSKWTKEHGRFLGYYHGLSPILLVSDLEILKTVLIKKFHSFSDRPPVFEFGNKRPAPENQTFSQLKGQKWKQVRSIVSPSFTINKMKLMAPIINGAVEDLLKNISKNETNKSFDIYALYKGLTMDVIGRTAFGIQTEAQNNPNDSFLRMAIARLAFNSFTQYLSLIAFSFPELTVFWSMLRNLNMRYFNGGKHPDDELRQACGDVITHRRNNPNARRADFLQLMIDTEISETELNKRTDQDLIAGENDHIPKDNSSSESIHMKKLSDTDMMASSVTFFLAGFETTSTALGFITHLLTNNQNIQEKVRQEIKDNISEEGLNYNSIQKLPYLDQVITESLRLYPPIYLFVNRESSEDIKAGDKYAIPKGVTVQVPTYILHHDEEYWKEPEKFNPDRFAPENKDQHNPLAWQPFGAGPRNCIGLRFALMEIKLTLATILGKYRFLPGDNFDRDLKMAIGNVLLRPQEGVSVKVECL